MTSLTSVGMNIVNYGDVHRQSEVEYSTYNFEHANVEIAV